MTDPRLCDCGHLHIVGDDEGADGGCTSLGDDCDCWAWHHDHLWYTGALDHADPPVTICQRCGIVRNAETPA